MLETIALPGTGRKTTRLGFGGSGLMGGISERESLQLLETAFDAGIRHFDVAPSYGHGLAERCVGKFLRGKVEQITIATKYGILPPQSVGWLGVARHAARPVARHLPAVRKRLARAAAGLKAKAYFSAEEGRRSLDRSLLNLNIDRVDLWLLHEVSADDLDGSDLLFLLQRMQQTGRIGLFGIGTGRSHLDALWSRHRAYCPVLQFEASALEGVIPAFPGAFCIYHRVISNGFDLMRKSFQHDIPLCRRWSEALDADLTAPEVLAGLLLQAFLLSNPNSIVLFSSRVPAHIRSNLRIAEDAGWKIRAERFLELISNEKERYASTYVGPSRG